MSDGTLHTPFAQPLPGSGEPAVEAADPVWGELEKSAGRDVAPDQKQGADAFYKNLAQQMQAFLTRTDLQHRHQSKWVLEQTLQLLTELDQHIAREAQLQTALLDTQSQMTHLKHDLVTMAAESVRAEHEALAIAQARMHLATLLHDKLVQEFK